MGFVGSSSISYKNGFNAAKTRGLGMQFREGVLVHNVMGEEKEATMW